MIDTLKFARKMQDKGSMTREQAEALAESLNEALVDQVATKKDLELMESRLSNKLYGLGFTVIVAMGIIQHYLK
jgi:hypothetical protein